MPTNSSWVSGNTPRAIRVVTTGSPSGSRSAQLVAGAGADQATAGVDHGPLGGGDQVERLADHLAVPADGRAVAGQVDVVVPLPLEGGVEDVLGDVDEHRPGRPERATWKASLMAPAMRSACAPARCAW
jgi:hypothetical protein